MLKKARIAYTGPALEQGEMPIRDLAPALLAFAHLVESSYRAIGGSNSVQVLLNQDSLRKGSFDITFLLNLDILQQVKLFVASSKDVGLEDLMTVLGWGATVGSAGKGIFWLVQKIRSRRIQSIAPSGDNKAKITLEDGEIIETTKGTIKVLLDVDCRVGLEEIMKPLKKEGVESIELRNPDGADDKAPLVRIPKEEAPVFKAPPAEDVNEASTEREVESLVSIVSINFQNGKWRFSDGSAVFWASMEDEAFNNKVEKGEVSFTNGDMLRVRLRVSQFIKDGKLSSEYVATKVLEQRKVPKQIKLDFSYRADDENLRD